MGKDKLYWGFITSFNSSKEVSKTLSQFNTTLNSLIQPVIEMADNSWFIDANLGSLKCGDMPLGMNVKFKNLSLVPIKIINAKNKVYYNGIELAPDKDSSSTSEEIIPVNGFISTTHIFGNYELLRPLKNKHGVFDPPFFIIELKCIVCAIDNANKYNVVLRYSIGIDCDDWNHTSTTRLVSTYTPIPE
jgi:hypothetical protein